MQGQGHDTQDAAGW